ncbi:TIR domain-containing protein [Actinosynnema sp. NPDC059335]|uniref:TIR domain-containing protein n=1 Tax=Actinosynnema sp. NPDC059335 TaxID=3346804 RepID=UPI00366B1730
MTSRTRGYDAFISYSHQADDGTAARLQRLVRRVGRPWYQRSGLRIFRDQTNLVMSESLWESIARELRRSHHFVLIASPQAAKSTWVRREVRFWRDNRDRATFSVVRVAGTIAWDEEAGDFDWAATDALPPDLAGWFTSEPHWGDVVAADERERSARLRDVAVAIAARLYGVDKDELHDEDEREWRRTRRVRRGAVTALALLSALALVLGVTAVVQGGRADDEARVALSHRLASVAESQFATNLDVGNLLAVRAFRTDANARTRATLFRAVTENGTLVRTLPFDQDVVEVATSADGGAVAVVLRDGAVLRWRLDQREPERLFRLTGEPRGVSMSADGDVVVAASRDGASLARPGRPVEPLAVRAGWRVHGAAVSPSGRTALLSVAEDVWQGRMAVTAFPVGDGPLTGADHEQGAERAAAADLVETSDDEVFLLDSGYGFWERRRLSDWAVVAASRASFGTVNDGVAVAADRGAFGYTNGSPTIPVWRTDRETDIERPHLTAHAPIGDPDALALSPDASRLAVAEDHTVHVVPVGEVGAPPTEPVRLVGTGRITPDTLRFLGADGTALVAASGNRVAVWDTTRADRISRTFPVDVGSGCSACGPPRVAPSPDGSHLIAFDGAGFAGVAGPTDRPGAVRPLPDLGANLYAEYGPAVWDREGDRATVLVEPPSGGSAAAVPAGLPDFVRGVAAGERAGGVLAAGLTSDGRQVVVVGVDGGIDLVDPATGATRTVVPDPGAPVGPKPPRLRAGAVSATGDLAAVHDGDSVVVRAVRTGDVVGDIPVPDRQPHLVFVRDRLLVQRDSGELEVWDERGGRRLGAIAGDGGFFNPPASNGALVARVRDDGSTSLADLDSGAVVGTIPAGPPGRRVGVGFSGDGTELVAVTEGNDLGRGSATVRDVSDEALVRTACATAGRDLTPAEWDALLDVPAPADLTCR